VLDARVSAPTHCLTLTTRDPAQTAARYRDGSAVLFRRLRAEFGPVEYFAGIEFTSGTAKRLGGHRRMHGHYLLKPEAGIDVLDVERVAIDSWRRTTGAWRVQVAALVSPGAALGYLALHHRKASQMPPAGWRGMTERASRGYWHRPIAELRVQARRELAAEALAWRTGMPLELAALEVASRTPGEVVKVARRSGASVIEPMGALL
jgi:hypothetical protein